MKSGNNIITKGQLFSVLFLSRFFTNMTYIASMGSSITSSQAPFMILFSVVYLVAFSVPCMIFLKNDGSRGILDRSKNISPVLEKIVIVIFLIVYVYYSVVATARFEILASSVMFPRSSVNFFLFFVLAVCVFVAYRGIESLGRVSVIFTVLLFASLFIVLISLGDGYDYLNLGVTERVSNFSTARAGIYSASRTVEISTVPIMCSKVKGNVSKSVFKWIFAVGICLTGIEFAVSMVLGDFGYSQMFGTYALSVVAKVGVMEKFDAVITSMWILCFLAKLAYIFIVCNILIERLFPKKKKMGLVTVPVFVYFAALLGAYTIQIFQKYTLSDLSVYLFVIATFVLPLTVIIIEKIKGKGSKRNKSLKEVSA